MIEIKNLYKSINDKDILKNINLKIPTNKIFGLVGENGAGKTTLIKCLTGIYKATSGNILINNENVFENNNIKNLIGYVSDENSLIINFTVNELINFYKLTYSNFSIEKFNRLNDIFEIPITSKIKHLSKGMKTKVSIMLSLSICPKILILDEPLTGLDPISQTDFLNFIIDEVSTYNTTVFLSSHNMNYIEKICDNIAFIKNGEILLSSSLDTIKNNVKKVQVIFKDPNFDLNKIKQLNNVFDIQTLGKVVYITVNNFSNDFINEIKKFDTLFLDFIDLSLNEIFIYYMKGEL